MPKLYVARKEQMKLTVPSVATISVRIRTSVLNSTITTGALITPPQPNAKIDRVSLTVKKPIGAHLILKD